MKIVPIFVADENENGLWSIQMKGSAKNEFDLLFDSFHNPEWLYEFFEENEEDLNSGFYSISGIEDAVLRTIDEAGLIEDTLFHLAEQGFTSGYTNLQHLFKPLNNFEYAIVDHQKSKARVRKGWIRVYAIRLSPNCYVVTGGAIKLTLGMNRVHLQDEIRKLELTKLYLKEHGIDFPEDLNSF